MKIYLERFTSKIMLGLFCPADAIPTLLLESGSRRCVSVEAAIDTMLIVDYTAPGMLFFRHGLPTRPTYLTNYLPRATCHLSPSLGLNLGLTGSIGYTMLLYLFGEQETLMLCVNGLVSC